MHETRHRILNERTVKASRQPVYAATGSELRTTFCVKTIPGQHDVLKGEPLPRAAMCVNGECPEY